MVSKRCRVSPSTLPSCTLAMCEAAKGGRAAGAPAMYPLPFTPILGIFSWVDREGEQHCRPASLFCTDLWPGSGKFRATRLVPDNHSHKRPGTLFVVLLPLPWARMNQGTSNFPMIQENQAYKAQTLGRGLTRVSLYVWNIHPCAGIVLVHITARSDFLL